VSLAQLLVVASVSALVSALIVISATAETGPERAVIAALRERHVIHAPAPAPHAPAAIVASADQNAPTPAPATAAPSDSASSRPAATTSDAAPASSDPPAGSQASGPSSNSGSGTGTGDSDPAPKLASKVKHVFVIALSTPSYEAAFGQGSAATYLNSKLRPKGALLTNYHTLGAASMPDYVGLISGQKPNKDTTAGCPSYDEFHGGTAPDNQGLVPGDGCIYPNSALTIGDELDSADLPWRAYVEGMTAPCEHPDSGAPTTATGDYTPTLNPFVFFHSLLDLGDCQSDDLPYSAFARALGTAHRTPAFSYVAPDACDSGAATACPPDQPQGIAAADAFLRKAVPPILRSAAYRRDGALMIVFTATPPATPTSAEGPVRTGALVLSPYTRPGTTVRRSYGPYAVLRTVEDIFGLDALGASKQAHRFSEKTLADVSR
jgi:phosphatidylinositol-3-phosphatase